MILGAAYFLISRTLWQSMDTEKQLVKQTTGELARPKARVDWLWKILTTRKLFFLFNPQPAWCDIKNIRAKVS